MSALKFHKPGRGRRTRNKVSAGLAASGLPYGQQTDNERWSWQSRASHGKRRPSLSASDPGKTRKRRRSR